MQGKQVSTRLRGSDAHEGTETNNSSLLGCIERNREFLEGKHKEIRVKIESLGQKVIQISGKHVTKIMRAFFMISILIFPLIAVSSHPVDFTTSNALINSSGEQKSSCLRDDHCVVGFFCHDLTKSCVPCLKNECLKWKRRPGSTSCAKSQEHCGDCLQGFTDNHGHCQPVASSAGGSSESRADQGQGPGIHETSDTGLNWWKSTDSTYLIVAGVVVFCLLGTSAPFVFIYAFKLNKRHTLIGSSEGKHNRSPIAPEDLAQPPPYNPRYNSPLMRPLLNFDSDQSHDQGHSIRSNETSFSERPIQHESAAMAIAFSAGQFPTTADAAEEETPAEVNQSSAGDRVSPNASPEPPNTTPEPPDSGNHSELDTEESVNESTDAVQPEPEEVPEAPPAEGINQNIPVQIHPPPLFQLSVQVGINLQLNNGDRAAEVPPPVQHPPPPVTQRFRLDQSYVDLGVFANWNGDAGPSSDFDEEISGDMEEDLDDDVSFYD